MEKGNTELLTKEPYINNKAPSNKNFIENSGTCFVFVALSLHRPLRSHDDWIIQIPFAESSCNIMSSFI